jgi:trans-aconitate methyltransferase
MPNEERMAQVVASGGTDGVDTNTDWAGWLRRWDLQQEGYVPEREARFTAMFDALAELLPASFVALDLGCGPGSMSQRLLARFPEAQAIAVDLDPVLLAIGRGALGTVEARLRWVAADLASPDWLDAVGTTHVDAVVSSTALHWIEPEPLVRLYGDLASLLRPGGLLLNGDHLAFGPSLPTFVRLSQVVLDQQWTDAAFSERGIETAEQWWDSLASEPAFASLLAERTAAFAGKHRQDSPPGFDFHASAMRDAGFQEVGTIWQVLSDRVTLAIR